MSELAFQYLLFTFVASCGVLQMVAAYARLKGMLFFRSPALGYLLGALAVLGAFWWFFAIEDRNLRGIEGGGQVGYFNASMFLSIFFTLVVSSVTGFLLGLWRKRSGEKANPGELGLEALKELTYFQAMARSFRELRNWVGRKR